MGERITLFHGGTDFFGFRPEADDLYGLVFPGHSRVSGNLTDSRHLAEKFAINRCQVGGNPQIAVYEFDPEEVINLGPLGLTEEQGDGFRTVYVCHADNLSEGFLNRSRITRESAREMENVGVIFYRVPQSNFIAVYPP